MQSALIVFALLFVVACWVFVIVHQLGVSGFNPNGYEIVEGTLVIAYTVAAISLCAIVAAFVISVIKKGTSE